MIRLSNVPNVIAKGTRATTLIMPRKAFHIQDTDSSIPAGSHFPFCLGDQSSGYSSVLLLSPFGPWFTLFLERFSALRAAIFRGPKIIAATDTYFLAYPPDAS